MIDFTNCKVFKKSYNGANGGKLCIEYAGEKYMLKFPAKPTKNTELSYANGCISEYISCHIYGMLGVPVQETLLGTYSIGTAQKIVVACKDFTDIGVILQDFGSLKNQLIDSIHQGYGTELQDVLEAIQTQQALDPQIVLDRFWCMFVIDSLLGNFDRHNGNWGFLYDQKTDSLELAPVYDCGSCLYPQADKQTIQKILAHPSEVSARVFNFPTSVLKIDNRKISYYQFLTNTTDVNCLQACVDYVPKMDMNHFDTFIDSVECIDDLQKTFYKTMLRARYEKILVPAYERAIRLKEQEHLEDMELF